MADFEVLALSDQEPACEVVVGPGSRFFAGHFPGRPVLPAVAQLVLVCEVLRRSIDPGAKLVAIEHLRLLKPVHPGDRLSIRVRAPRDAGAHRFEIDCGTARISEGAFRYASVTTP